MTGWPTFGDFLHLAHQHLDTPAGTGGRAGDRENLEEVMRALSRLVAVMDRYTQDMTATYPEVSSYARPMFSPWAQACVQAREALANAGCFLAVRDRPHWRTPAPGPHARRLTMAAASLRMGRDLLQTHFAPGAGGGRRQRSEWARVVSSDAVNRALLTDIAALAHKAASQCADVALRRSATVVGERQARRRLNAACQWLWALAAGVRAAGHRDPPGHADGELLAAIPLNSLPPRHALQGGEPVAALCDGAVSSAERVRHLAWRAAAQVPVARDLTTASLRHVAETSTVTGHNCAALLGILATRMTQEGFPELGGRLAAAAEAAGRARDTWLQAAREITRVQTVTQGQPSLAAVEAGELAAWTGRLAYADPQWSPSDGPHRATRPPETLAMNDVPPMVAAAHQASETLTSLASADHDQIRAAARSGCILVPTRSLPDDYDIPYPFAHAPQERIARLLNRYAEAGQASRQAADAVGEVAEMVQAPSRTLTLARRAVVGRADRVLEPVPERSAEADRDVEARDLPGPVESTLLDLGVTDAGLLTRSAEIDREAERLIIDAAASTGAWRRPSSNGLNRSAGTAALANHALRSGDSRAVALLGPPGPSQRESPEPEP